MTTRPTSPPLLTDAHAARTRLLARLNAFRADVRRRIAIGGLARVLVLALALAVFSLLVDRLLHLSLPMRLVGLVLGLAGLGWGVFHWLIEPLGKSQDLVGLAAAAERRNVPGLVGTDGRPVLAARVATVLQMPDLAEGYDQASAAFIDLAVRNSAAALDGVDFRRYLDDQRHRTHLGVMASAIILPILWAALDPSSAGIWARRWFLASNEGWPRKNYLEIAGLDGNRIVVPRGEPFTLRVGEKQGTPQPASVGVRWESGGSGTTSAPMIRFAPGDFRYEFPPVQDPISVRISGGDDAVGPFTIDPVDRPRIVALELMAQHPRQTQPEKHTFSGADADAAFLPKTHLELTVTANVDVGEAHVQSAALPGAELKRLDARRFSLVWTHEKAVEMEIDLFSADAHLASTPTPIAIALKVDQPPRVTLQYTGVRTQVTPTAHIPLNVQARDDYGLAAIDLAIQSQSPDATDAAGAGAGAGGGAGGAGTQPGKPALAQVLALFGPHRPTDQLAAEASHTVDLSPLALKPGSVLNVTASAQDDCYTGPQTSRSRTVSFHVVTPEDLFKDIRVRLQGERVKLRRVADEEQAILDVLEAQRNKTTHDGLAPLARRHLMAERQTAVSATILADTLTEMRLNDLGTPQANDLMARTVVTPLHQVHDDLMVHQREVLDALAQALATDHLPEAQLTDAITRQQGIIDQLHEVLRQMGQWDSFMDVINQLNEIIHLQQDARKGIGKAQEDAASGLFKK